MPIRINLLAEAQALEEERRKDPVKRALMGSAVVVVVMLLWSMILQFKIWAVKSELSGYQAKWESIDKDYQLSVSSHRELIQAENRLAALESLNTNRFLWGTALNALQQTMNGVDRIRVVRLRAQQNYLSEPGKPAVTNGVTVIPAKPITASEKISISVEAKDFSNPPGGQVSLFKKSILAVPYFKDGLQKTNGVLLTSLSPPQDDPETLQPFVKFTLQCHFPEKVR